MQRLALMTAALILAAAVPAAAEDGLVPTVVSDKLWCKRMLPAKNLAKARERCVRFLGRIADEPAKFALADTVVKVLTTQQPSVGSGTNADVPGDWKWNPPAVIGSDTDTGDSLSLDAPAGIQAGDLIVVAAATRNAALGAPSGLGTLETIFFGDTGSDEDTGAWAKIATGSESGASVTLSASGTQSAGVLLVLRREDGVPYTEFDYIGGVDRRTDSCPAIAGARAGDLWLGIWTGSYDGVVTQNDIGEAVNVDRFGKGPFAQDGTHPWASIQYHPVLIDQDWPAIVHNRNDLGFLSNGCLLVR